MPETTRISRPDYYEMERQGFFVDQHVDRMDGLLIFRPQQSFPHSFSLSACHEALSAALSDGFWIRSQVELALDEFSDPEPDLSVVSGSIHDYRAHPTSALLIVEVSDETLAFDRGPRASLYAKAGIADYWIVNLVERQVEVYRRPEPDAAQPFGFGYAERCIFRPGQAIAPQAKPSVQIEVAPLFPPV